MYFVYNMKLRLLFISVFIIGFSVMTFAQNANELLCKVLDFETKYPVSFATIKFDDVQNGVIADEDGEFRLPIDYKSSGKTIIISSIGFETLRINAGSFNLNTINKIYLRPKVEELSAVLVVAQAKSITYEPETIIKEAIKRIPFNYPRTPHSYMAYYRDYQLVNNNYYNLNEFILETFDAGFQTNKFRNSENRTALYSYDLNDDYYLDSLLLKSVYGQAKVINKDESAQFNTALENELEILNGHNAIRNFDIPSFSFVDTFRDDFVNNHDFKLEGIKYIEDTPLFEISFASKNTEVAKFRAKGTIYIAKGNYAIYKIEYKMIENENFAQYKIQSGNSTKFELRERLNTLYEVNVEYKPHNDKMYLNYITFNNRFIIKEPNPFKVSDFEFDPNDQAFYISFNKAVDESSIARKSRFRVLYKDKKLIIKDIELVKPKMVKIQVLDWAAGTGASLEEVKSEDFSYRVKKIKDATGAKLNKDSKLLGYQFREFFTQEIFEDKKPNNNLIFVTKTLPILDTRVNPPTFDIDKYWVNSPLKKTKGGDL